jgi:plastocyanin
MIGLRNYRAVVILVSLAACAAGCRVRYTGAVVRPNADEAADLRKSLGAGVATAGEAAAAVEPTGFATLKGTFKLVGSAPPRPPVAVNKDMDVCMPGGKPVLGEQLVVDGNGGIKDVVVYCITKMPAGDAKWEHSDYLAQKDAKVTFDQKNCVFLTHVLATRTGQTVLLKNSDTVGHNTNIAAKGKAIPINVTIGSNDSSQYTVAGEPAEPFDVSCNVHPWMSAKMITRDNPCFAVTKPDGSFEIKVPAGVDLDFKVWQESSKFIQEAKVNGTAAKWPRGKLSFKGKDVLKPDEVRTLEVTVDVSAFGK